MFPEPISPEFKDVLSRSMAKDPLKRINLDQLFEHPWMTKNGEIPLFRTEAEAITVTWEEIARAISKRQVENNIFALAKVKSKLTRQRQSSQLKSMQTMKSGIIGMLPDNDIVG